MTYHDIWQVKFAKEWNETTAFLKQFDHLDHIKLSTGQRDIREKIVSVYGRQSVGVKIIADELDMKAKTLHRKAKGDLSWSPYQKKMLKKLLELTDEECKWYFGEE